MIFSVSDYKKAHNSWSHYTSKLVKISDLYHLSMFLLRYRSYFLSPPCQGYSRDNWASCFTLI